MKIAVLQTGGPPENLRPYGTYGQMFTEALQPLIPGANFIAVETELGQNAPTEIDGVVITGSSAAVYESHSWIAPLKEAIRDYGKACVPVVGICFGHQIMAEAYDGKVQRSAKGWGVGVHHYPLYESGKAILGQEDLACVVSHRDQVEEVPESAEVLAGSDFCPHGAFFYPAQNALSFQMHPEMSHDFARELLCHRAKDIEPEKVKMALASYQTKSGRDAILCAMAKFFNGNEREEV
jgi:GMP synthase-like glutamine amidotransferase